MSQWQTEEKKEVAELFVSDYYFLPSSQQLDYITIETHSHIFFLMKHISPSLSLSPFYIYMGGRKGTKQKKFSIIKIISRLIRSCLSLHINICSHYLVIDVKLLT
jgi:hypothetical protein